MAKTTTTQTQTQIYAHTGDTGVLGRSTRALLEAMIRRGVTDYGITGLGAGYREDISDKDRMIRHRITCAAGQDDVSGIVDDIAQAYADHQGCHLWACTAADPGAPTLDWTQDGGAPDAATAEGMLYLAIRCKDNVTRGAALAVLERADIGGLVELADSIILTPIVVGIDDLTAAAAAIDAIDTIVGGGVAMVPMCDYVDITDPSGARTRGEASGTDVLLRIQAITDVDQAWDDPALAGIMDTQPVSDYCAEYGIKITDDFGGAAYKGYYRYKTKYGTVLQHAETMKISLSPALGCRYDTWAQLYEVCTRQASDADRERTRALVDELRASERKEEPRFITLDYALDHEDDVPDVTYIPTGVKVFDNAWLGYGVGKVTVLTGYSGNGKSTFLIQSIANMINDGRRVVVYGGEGTWLENLNINLCNVLAGKENLIKIVAPDQDPSDPNAAYQFMRRPEVKQKIRDWQARDRRIWLYDSDCYGSDAKEVTEWCTWAVKEHHADVLILDNLMKMGLTKAGHEANNKLVDYINMMSQYAKKAQVAVVMVAHPIKDNRMLSGGKRLLTMDDIKGCVEVSQLVDKVMIVYANRTDFKDGYEARYGKGSYDHLPGGDGYIVVDKVRGLPQRPDLFLPIFFEPGTCRILSRRDEVYRYEWQDMA